ncbi:MAG: MarR family transcriptional regulator [Oscillospiraceae bacterium]|nr:MarR family transcriptional regulator [Oscillospiraceae bacterium]
MSEVDNTLFERWIKLETEFHRYHDLVFKRLGPVGAPHRGQGRLLCIIGEHPNITQKQLCEISQMRQQSVSELLKKLENNNYISRCTSPADKRISIFNLTEEGEKFTKPPKEVVESFNSFFSCLNDAEKKNMSDYLLRIYNNVEKMLNNNNQNKVKE